MNKFTYGNSPAAVTLANEISLLNDGKINRQVGRIISNSFRTLKSVAVLSEREYLINLIEVDIYACIDGRTWPENIKTFTKNIIAAQAKAAKLNKHKR